MQRRRFLIEQIPLPAPEMDPAPLRILETGADEILADGFVFAGLLPVVSPPCRDVRADEVGHTRRHDDLVAEGESLYGAFLVVRPLAVLGIAELEAPLLLVEVHDVSDHHAASGTGEGMLLHVLVADLRARDDLRIAGDTDDRAANCHREISIVSTGEAGLVASKGTRWLQKRLQSENETGQIV